MSTKSYYLYKKQERYSGQDWADVIPQVLSPDGDGTMSLVIKSNDDSVCTSIYSLQYLTFVAQTDGLTVRLLSADSSNVFQYSTDSGATWNSIANSGTTSSVNSGQTIMFKASGLTVDSSDGIGTLKPSVSASVQGNVMSLVYGDNFTGQTTIENANQFKRLFYNCANITSAENLILPATTLADNCYSRMFYNCTSLTTAPELSATTLASGCYSYMFNGCTSLTAAPELPATTLAVYCYQFMFWGCTSLTTAPELSATTLADWCYSYMFQGCTSLTTAPELPATTLARGCYASMFAGCTSLTTAPELPATTLASRCYQGMFYNCTSLIYIKCLATDISADICTDFWVNGVASTGTFVKAASMSSWTTGISGIPDGWTVQNN